MGRRYRTGLTTDPHDADAGVWLSVREDLVGGWEAEYRFMARDGVPVLRSVAVRPQEGNVPPLGGLTVRKMREARIPDAAAEARAYLAGLLEAIASADGERIAEHEARHRGVDEDQLPEYIEEWLDRFGGAMLQLPTWSVHLAGYTAAEALKEPRRPGRRGRPDRYFAAVAAEYVELVEAGSRRPVADLAERHLLSAGTIRDTIKQARWRELLTDTPRGVPGGQLTPKALALLSPDG